MNIKTYTLKDLMNKLNSKDFWKGEIIPITKHRAISHLHNPRANDDDILLAVVYDDDGKVIGYRGFIPDIIYLDKPYKMAWYTTIWVSPEHRRKGIGSKLNSIAAENYNSIFGSSRFSVSSGGVYKNSKQFMILKELKGINYFFRSKIANKYKKQKFLIPLLYVADSIFTAISLVKQKIWLAKHNTRKLLDIEYIFELDTETKEFIEKKFGNNLLRRGADELNWIIKFPWVLNAPLKDKFEDSYYFSSVSKEMKYINLKIINKNENIIAFIMLKIRDGVLNIPYIYFEEEYADDIAKIIVFHIIKLNISNAYIYNDIINSSLIKLSVPAFRNKPILKESVISNKFEKENLDNYTLQEGDGDCVFT